MNINWPEAMVLIVGIICASIVVGMIIDTVRNR